MKRVLYIIVSVAVAMLVSGCSLYTKFDRPQVRNLHELYEADTTYNRLADLGWKEFFTDTLLQKYIADSAALYESQVTSLPISTIGSTIGTHAGPGAIAVAFFGKQ